MHPSPQGRIASDLNYPHGIERRAKAPSTSMIGSSPKAEAYKESQHLTRHRNRGMSIAIITAYQDIGRGKWPVFTRSTKTYLQRFRWMCELKNRIIAYVDPRLRPAIEEIRLNVKPDLEIIYWDAIGNSRHLLERIHAIQRREDFKTGIETPHCPEYWSPEYVLITNLKSAFCVDAISRLKLSENHVAWLDFGYIRDPGLLPISRLWDYDFGSKINLLPLRRPEARINYADVIKSNTVYIHGAHIVAPPTDWSKLHRLVNREFQRLLDFNLVDDDQTLWLMAYQTDPGAFELRMRADGSHYDLFGILKDFNRHS